MKVIQPKTHKEVLDSALQNSEFREGYVEELEKLRIVDSLIQLRERRGLTQAELARRMGVSQSFIARLESGQTHNFTLETLVKFSIALDSHLQVQFRPRLLKAA